MDYKNATTEDFMKELGDKRECLRVFRFGSSGSKVKNVKEGRAIRKDIARVLTEINSRKVFAPVIKAEKKLQK